MAYMKPGGKGWRLLSPDGKRVFRARLVATFNSRGERFVLYKIGSPKIGKATAGKSGR